MTTILYGIKTCDTVRKARRWLEQHQIDYRYHDLREEGIDADLLADWTRHLDWERLLNRRSTTWKQLPPEARENIDRQRALDLLLSHPTLVKRPVLVSGEQHMLGFDPEHYARWFQRHTL